MFIILLFEIALVLMLLLWVKRKFIKEVNVVTLDLLILIGIGIFIMINYTLLTLTFYLEKRA